MVEEFDRSQRHKQVTCRAADLQKHTGTKTPTKVSRKFHVVNSMAIAVPLTSARGQPLEQRVTSILYHRALTGYPLSGFFNVQSWNKWSYLTFECQNSCKDNSKHDSHFNSFSAFYSPGYIRIWRNIFAIPRYFSHISCLEYIISVPTTEITLCSGQCSTSASLLRSSQTAWPVWRKMHQHPNLIQVIWNKQK